MIVIHIGLRKSGSASLQMFLRENQEKLRQMSIDFPKIGREHRKEHHNFVYEIMDRPIFDPARGTLADLVTYWDKSQYKTMLLSSEMFEAAEKNQISRIKVAFDKSKRGVDKFVIFVVLRDLVDLIASSYAQKVKFGFNTYGFDEFFAERMTEERNDYYYTVKKWADVFGWDGMRIRLLDRKCLLNGDLIDDFLATSGIDVVGDHALHLNKPGIVNASPGWRVLEAVRALFSDRHGLPEGHPLAAAVKSNGRSPVLGMIAMKVAARPSWTTWNAERGRYLTRAQAQQCLKTYRRSIATLNKVLPEALPLPPNLETRGFLERDFLPDVSRLDSTELRSFYEQMLSILSIKKTYQAPEVHH